MRVPWKIGLTRAEGAITRQEYVWGDEFQDPIRDETVRGNTQCLTFTGGFRF